MQSSEPARRPLPLGRIWDVVALVVVAFALWKIFVAPRSFAPPRSFPAPHAVYERLDGDAFRVTAARGRVAFLDFYATWCVPCKIELPLVEAWSQRHPEAVVVPIDVGEPRTVASSFARRLGLRGVALDPGASAGALFGVEGFPTIVVIDPEGYIRAKWQGLNPAIAPAMSNALRLRSGQAPSKD
ncbi:MAG TPA: TlpA disulfide reductase family protein [Candidatus Binatia bacterium]|nr:TlpA disulfide reductase family protein [Candidatus Binatia bacterium]